MMVLDVKFQADTLILSKIGFHYPLSKVRAKEKRSNLYAPSLQPSSTLTSKVELLHGVIIRFLADLGHPSF